MFFFSILRDHARVVAYQEQNTKGYIKFLALKVVAVAAKNIWEVVAYERVFETVFDWNKTVIYKAVAYGRWSLTRSGRYKRVDCTTLFGKF